MSPSLSPSLRRADVADAEVAADVYLRSREAAGDALPPGVHPPHEVREYVAGVLLPTHECWLASVDGEPAGFLALDGSDLHWLWVVPEHQGTGIGSALLDLAKDRRPDGLELWVFTSNAPAQRFYARRGFTLLYETDGSGNEERSPDRRLAWRPLR